MFSLCAMIKRKLPKYPEYRKDKSKIKKDYNVLSQNNPCAALYIFIASFFDMRNKQNFSMIPTFNTNTRIILKAIIIL